MSEQDDDAAIGLKAAGWFIILVASGYFLYDIFTGLNEASKKSNCVEPYDSFECRVNMQIREDAQIQIKYLEKRIKDAH